MQQQLDEYQIPQPELARLRPHDHPCLIYETADEQADAYVSYLYGGLLQGELCVYVVDETHPEFILTAFRQRNVDVEDYYKSGRLRIITKKDAYLTEGFFDINKMVTFWETTVAKALSEGYSAVRAAAEMTWSLGDEPGVNQLVPYESVLNEVFPRLKVSALCQYNRKRFDATTIKEMINVHPLVVAGNHVLPNPGFIPHNDFIKSHDEMEVQKMLDVLALSKQLQQRNLELEDALRAQQEAVAERQEAQRLQQELEEALEAEQKTRVYAESVKTELEEFVNNATEGLHWVGPDSKILWANRAELDLLGYTEAEYVGHDIREFHVDKAVIQDIFKRLNRKETLRNYQARLKAKDGSIKHVLISSNVLWRNGEFVHTQCFTRDITDLALARRQVEQADEIRQLNEELQSLARVVSHELQEPIAKIRSYLNLLSVRYKGRLGADADEFIGICTSSAKIVERMIEDLWLFARITKPDDDQVAVVSAGSILAGVIHEYKDQIDSTHAEISIGELPRVRYSEKHLKYIFESLLNNALTYRREGVRPSIAFSAELLNGHWQFAIQDNGTGIDQMHLRDIFKAFFRIGSRPGEGGTGMGLAISQKVVQSRGGEIWADSQPGRGSTFYFTIPSLPH
jgi:PAS domain S-box-containing protein